MGSFDGRARPDCCWLTVAGCLILCGSEREEMNPKTKLEVHQDALTRLEKRFMDSQAKARILIEKMNRIEKELNRLHAESKKKPN